MESKPPKSSKYLLWGVLALFILPGLSIGLYGTVMSVISSGWTTVEATIEDAKIQGALVRSSRSANAKRNSRRKRSVRRLRISYTYLWEGDTLNNERIAFLQGYSNRKINQNTIAQKLKVGDKVVAYVNPRNPQKAVLVRGIHNTILFGYVSALSCFLFFGALAGIFFEFPSSKWGWRSLILMVILYIVYFGIGIDRSVLRLIEFVP